MASGGVLDLARRLAALGREPGAPQARQGARAALLAVTHTAAGVGGLARGRYQQLEAEERALADRVVTLSGAGPMLEALGDALGEPAPPAAADVAETVLKTARLLQRVLHLRPAADLDALIEWLEQLSRPQASRDWAAPAGEPAAPAVRARRRPAGRRRKAP